MMPRYMRPGVGSSSRGGARERCTLVRGQYRSGVVGGVLWCTLLSKEHRGEEWELEEQMVEEYGDKEWEEHRQDTTFHKQNHNHQRLTVPKTF